MAKKSEFQIIKNGLLLFLFVVIGCTAREKKKYATDDNNAIMSIIEDYISHHPDYDTFLLCDSWDEVFSEEEFPSGYFLGPCHHGLLKQRERYDSIDIGTSCVYIKSSKLRLEGIVGECSMNNTTSAETSMKEEYMINDAWQNFIEMAIFIYQKNDVWFINNRPDSIFSPQCVESDIRFTIN